MDQAEKDMVIERAIWAFGNLKLSRYGMRVAMRALRALHMAESPDDIKELQRLVIVLGKATLRQGITSRWRKLITPS